MTSPGFLMDLPLSSVHVPARRLRDYDLAWAKALAADMAARGQIEPILVRPRPKGGFWLVTGLHRLEAARLLAAPHIEGREIRFASDAEAIGAEAASHLTRFELLPLDRCRTVAELKDLWDATHGEARGGDRRSVEARAATEARRGDQTGKTCLFDRDASEGTAFERNLAHTSLMSWRAIRLCVTIWDRLSPASRRLLVGTTLAANQAELQLLSAQPHQRQSDALDLILDRASPVDSVAAALDALDGLDELTRQDRKFTLFAKAFGALPEARLDQLLVEQEARVIASLRRRGRL